MRIVDDIAGIRLRDYFAAKALQGIMADNEGYQGNTYAETAEWAYGLADAMLKEREKTNG
jgi:hypothetical protein